MQYLFVFEKMILVKEVMIFVTATLLVSFFIKKLINIAHLKHLFDEPLQTRKIHKTKTPNLGGIAIIGAMAFTAVLFINTQTVPFFSSIFFSLLVLFLTGVSDDLIGVSALKKLMMQLIASFVVVSFGFRFTSLYGVFGWSEIPYWVSFISSVFFITFVINAFNLIDGINCLAGSIGLLASACFGFYFWQLNDVVFASFATALCGCLAGFLWFNKTPAKIFMGDTGSMFIGFVIALFSIHLLSLTQQQSSVVPASQIINIIAALLMIPVYDTVRVLVLRIVHSQSPFTADRNHIHHRLIDLELSHLQATVLLVALNVFFIIIAFVVQSLRPEFFVLSAFLLLTAFNGTLFRLHTKKQRLILKENKKHKQDPEIRIIMSEKSIVNI